MRRNRSILTAAGAALLAFVAVLGFGNLAHAYNLNSFRESGDIASVPQRPDIALAAISRSDPAITISGASAVAAAEAEFNLRDDQIDASVGVVHAAITVQGSPVHRNEPVWIVTADVPSRGHGAANANLVFQKACVVINASTGDYEFAYQADPTPAAP